MTGAKLIAQERRRQMEVEGWSSEHDDKHTDGELAEAAATYASYAHGISFRGKNLKEKGCSMSVHHHPKEEVSIPDEAIIIVSRAHRWPWGLDFWKPSPDNRIKELVKAGALIAAEIDRLKRVENGAHSKEAEG